MSIIITMLIITLLISNAVWWVIYMACYSNAKTVDAMYQERQKVMDEKEKHLNEDLATVKEQLQKSEERETKKMIDDVVDLMLGKK